MRKVCKLIMLLGCLAGASCGRQDSPSGSDEEEWSIPVEYRPTEVEVPKRARPNVQAQLKPIEIKADLSNIENLDDFRFSDDQRAFISKNHFLIYDANIANPISVYRETPVPFVTSDILLHVFHVLTSDSLARTERKLMKPALRSFLKEAITSSVAMGEKENTRVLEAAHRNSVVLGVAASLLGNAELVQPELKEEIIQAVGRIRRGELSEFRGMAVDSSQFRPQALIAPSDANPPSKWSRQEESEEHHQANTDRDDYFRALAWIQQIGWNIEEPEELLGLCLMAEIINNNPNARKALTIFEQAIDIFAETRDGIGMIDVLSIVHENLGTSFQTEELSQDQLENLKRHLSEQLWPRVLGRIEKGATVHTATKLVFTVPGRYSLTGDVFQRILEEEQRLPSGLDFAAAVLDCPIARKRWDASGQSGSVLQLAKEVSGRSEEQWFSSLGAGLQFTIMSLVNPSPAGYPEFMRNEAWQKKSLNTSLGAFVQLNQLLFQYEKHAAYYADGGGEANGFYGYVEPNLEFLSRLKHCVLVHQTRLNQLSHAGFAYTSAEFTRYNELLDTLLEMSRKELKALPFTMLEISVLKSIGQELRTLTFDTSNIPDKREKSLICDLATDYLARRCLQVATGRPMVIVVIVPRGDQLYLAKGSIFSYYEFESPSTSRMTAKEWLLKPKAPIDSWLGNQGMVFPALSEVHSR